MARSTHLFDRVGRYEPADTIAAFAFNPMAKTSFPEFTAAIIHRRTMPGDQTNEQLAHKSETTTIAAVTTYAYDQIDQARVELNAVSK